MIGQGPEGARRTDSSRPPGRNDRLSSGRLTSWRKSRSAEPAVVEAVAILTVDPPIVESFQPKVSETLIDNRFATASACSACKSICRPC